MEKYSDKFINQKIKLEDAIIGFEFEFYMNKGFSYSRTIAMLDKILDPVNVYGFKTYHSDFKPTGNNFKLENDFSGGADMVELITSPLPYYEAKCYLVKIIKFIQDYGYTTDKASIHFNISFSDNCIKNLSNLNMLKLILDIDEDEIYNKYPMRKGNVYAKSVKKIIPYKDYDFFNTSINIIHHNLRIPNDKYFGINFQHVLDDKDNKRLEYRYIGGENYEKNVGNLLYFMDKFIIYTYDAINADFTEDNVLQLQEYLKTNNELLNTFNKYDNFIANYPSITVQIDRIYEYDIVSSYYDQIYDKLFHIMTSIEDLKDCIINYASDTHKYEIIDANIKTSTQLYGIDLINCECNGIFKECFFVNCEVLDSQIENTTIRNSDITNSKLSECDAENSNLNNCYFVDGLMNCNMYGGVLRSGKIGDEAYINSDVNIVNGFNNFFEVNYNNIDKKIVKGYDKR